MNDYIISVLLGIVEGLTEFLPVSSTAHLRITEALLHISLTDPYWKMYTVVIQFGAIFALLLIFTARIIQFFRTFPKGENGDRTIWTHPISLTMIAFVVTAIPAWLLAKTIGKNLESLRIMALALLIGGIVMWIIDAWSSRSDPRTTEVEQMSLGQAIWIGFCQIFSGVFPGTSRSMSTIAGGQIAGLSRPAALEFSFLVSIPTMIAATGYATLKTVHPSHKDPTEVLTPLVMTTHGWIVLAIGLVVSFIVALGVVEWFLQWVRKHGFTVFAIYRILLAIALLVFGARLGA
ncbi:MAG TPA: undecaprenyl-diphosphate phosphatase [Silvibacterium sp.]|nr:undecaprenyl-diphosphate phosphatase [Silvibacterium sp.]